LQPLHIKSLRKGISANDNVAALPLTDNIEGVN